ncbi:MAG: riboflavin kinase [Patescibacteria group bacterium]
MSHVITGTVIKGSGIGKKLGLPPTMNVHTKEVPKTLKFGIYAVRVKMGGRFLPGVAHYGPRPAVHAPKSFEVHCWDFGRRKNMYGKKITVEIVKRLRPVKNFKTIAGLKRAIERDIAQAQKIL